MTPEEQKKYTYIGAGLLALIGGYFLFFNKKDGSSGVIDPTGNNGNAGGSTNVFNAYNVATALYDAMKNIGTDEETVVTVLKTVSQVQFGEVFSAFGKLPYNITTGNQLFAVWQTVTKYDLKKWMYEELSTTEYNNLRRKYPNFL